MSHLSIINWFRVVWLGVCIGLVLVLGIGGLGIVVVDLGLGNCVLW